MPFQVHFDILLTESLFLVLAVTLSSTCSTDETLTYCTSVLEEKPSSAATSVAVEAPDLNASPAGMVQSNQVLACDSGSLSHPLYQQEEVDYGPSFPGTIPGQDLNTGVNSAPLSASSLSSDSSQHQVSSCCVSVNGFPVNSTSEVTASSTDNIYLPKGLVCTTSAGSRPVVTGDNSSRMSTAPSSEVPRLSSQSTTSSISSAGVMPCGDNSSRMSTAPSSEVPRLSSQSTTSSISSAGVMPCGDNSSRMSTAPSSEVPRLSSQSTTSSISSAGVMPCGDRLSPMSINSAAFSNTVPRMTQVAPPFVSSTGVTSSRLPNLPLLPLQQPRVGALCPVYASSIPRCLYLPPTGPQIRSPSIPGFCPLIRYPPLRFVTNSGQPQSNPFRECPFNSNPLTTNSQRFASFQPQTLRGGNDFRTRSTDVTSHPNHRIATWMTSAGHLQNRNDNGSSIMTYQEGHVGTSRSITGQNENHVGACSTSVGQQMDNDGIGGTSMGHQNEHVSTSSGHRRAHVDMGFASIAHQGRNVGCSSTSIGHQRPDHVSSIATSAEQGKDCVGSGDRSVSYKEDNNTIFNDEATFSISSLLPQLPDEVASRTDPDVASQRQTTGSNRDIIMQEPCSKLEKALRLISKRDVADYGWLLDRQTVVTEVKSLKRFIEKTKLALKVDNNVLQRSRNRLTNQISVYQSNVRKEAKKYELKNALIEERSVAKEGRYVKRKEAELEEMLAKIKVLSGEMEAIEAKWLKREGTVLGFKQIEPGNIP